jgi:ribosomal protein S18 acetylase RimI-like enzyme
MDVTFRPATHADLDPLLEMMRGLYEHDRQPFDRETARRATLELLGDESLGRLWLMEAAGASVGYIVLTYGFSIEFHGRDALVDELFVRSEFRGQGLGRRALEFVAAECLARGIHAVHLVVDHANERAQAVYRAFGFAAHQRHVMTKWLDD